MSILECRTTWNLSDGGPGFSVQHFLATGTPATIPAKLRTFYESLKANMPNDISVTYPIEAITRDTVTGAQTAFTALTTAADTTGTWANAWPTGSGICLVLETGGVVAGRRLRGKWFLVPWNMADVNGLIQASIKSNVEAAFATLLSDLSGIGSNLMVWSRKHGTAISVTSGHCKNHTSLMRRRKGVG